MSETRRGIAAALAIFCAGVTFGQCGPASWHGITPAPDWGVEALAEYRGELYVGGPFVSVGGMAASGIARWNGAAWQPVGGGVTGPFLGQVLAMTVYNGDLIVAGQFTSAGGVVVNNIARWNGTTWAPLGSGIGGVLPTVSALTVYNGELIAGGFFSTAGGVAVNGIASWNGSVWQPVGPVVPVSVSLFALAVYNGQLIAAGSVPVANGIARWTGSVWAALGTGMTGFPNQPFGPGYVTGLTVWNGELVAGGFFQFAGGVTANSIARWNGAVWQPFGTGSTGLVYSWGVVDELTVWNGDLIVGGEFSAIDGVPLSRIGRYDGTTWHAMGPGLSSTNDPVRAFATFHGALFSGGYSPAYGGTGSPHLARWSTDAAFLSFAQPAGAGAPIFITNGWRTPGHEYFNLFSFEPAPGGLGTGPYGGLFFANPALLIQQLTFPAGFAPFHVIAGVETEAYGPYPVVPGLYLEAISADVTGGVVGCISAASAYTEL